MAASAPFARLDCDRKREIQREIERARARERERRRCECQAGDPKREVGDGLK